LSNNEIKLVSIPTAAQAKNQLDVNAYLVLLEN